MVKAPPPARTDDSARISFSSESLSSIASSNLLVEFSSRLLSLITTLRIAKPNGSLETLHINIVREIRAFEYQAQTFGFSMHTILAARYCLCTAIDETILNTSWGSQGMWGQHSLLSFFHKETLGGERFYIILEKMAERPQQNLSILELMYVLFSLGFEGKYFDKGKVVLEAIRYSIYQKIHPFLHMDSETLSEPFERKVPSIKRKPILPLWALATILGATLVATALACRYKIHTIEDPLFDTLQGIPETYNNKILYENH